jgi:hypothetical protein
MLIMGQRDTTTGIPALNVVNTRIMKEEINMLVFLDFICVLLSFSYSL